MYQNARSGFKSVLADMQHKADNEQWTDLQHREVCEGPTETTRPRRAIPVMEDCGVLVPELSDESSVIRGAMLSGMLLVVGR